MPLIKQSDTIINNILGAGNTIVYEGVRVRAYQGEVEQQLYSDEAGTPVSVVQTDANGLYEFWIEEGDYSLRFSISGVEIGRDDYSFFEYARKSDLPYTGPLTSGTWTPYRMFPRIKLTGSGTVVFDGRDDSGNIFTATETYTVSNVQDLIRYPFFGDFTTEVRATITGSLIVELI